MNRKREFAMSPDLDDVIGVVVIKIPVQIEAACLEG
jgi:hypothetical protein